jgi:hypothetical protein
MCTIMELDDPLSTSGDHLMSSKIFFSDSTNAGKTRVGQILSLSNDSELYWSYGQIIFPTWLCWPEW